MNEDRTDHQRRQIAGSVKELIGKLIGNRNIEDEGAREKAGDPAAATNAQPADPRRDDPDERASVASASHLALSKATP